MSMLLCHHNRGGSCQKPVSGVESAVLRGQDACILRQDLGVGHAVLRHHFPKSEAAHPCLHTPQSLLSHCSLPLPIPKLIFFYPKGKESRHLNQFKYELSSGI